MPRPAKNIEEQLLRENPKLRDQGLRPVIVWVPDTEAPGFQDDVKRQIKAINESPDNEEVLELVDHAAADLFAK
jgi:Antitoxin MazE-like